MRTWAIVSLAALLGAAMDSEPFFDGKSLAGWHGINERWTVKDEVLTGSTFPDGIKSNTFLCSKKTFRDFELKFRIRLKDGKGNSGVQIRSELVDDKKFTVRGPQCDIGAGYWGSLYGEDFGGMMKAADPEVIKKAVKPAEFNDYFIRAVGKRVTIKINGTTMIDEEFPKLPDEGIIAWQLHAGEAMEATFEKIEFKEIKDVKK